MLTWFFIQEKELKDLGKNSDKSRVSSSGGTSLGKQEEEIKSPGAGQDVKCGTAPVECGTPPVHLHDLLASLQKHLLAYCYTNSSDDYLVSYVLRVFHLKMYRGVGWQENQKYMYGGRGNQN